MVAVGWPLLCGQGLLVLQLSSLLLQHVAAQDERVAPLTTFNAYHNVSMESITIGGARRCKPLLSSGHLPY